MVEHKTKVKKLFRKIKKSFIMNVQSNLNMKSAYIYKIIVVAVISLITALFLLEITGVILLFLDISLFENVLGVVLFAIYCLISILFANRLSKYLSYINFINAVFDVSVFTIVGAIIWVGLAIPLLSVHSTEELLLFWKPLGKLSIIGAFFGFPFGFLSAFSHFLWNNQQSKL